MAPPSVANEQTHNAITLKKERKHAYESTMQNAQVGSRKKEKKKERKKERKNQPNVVKPKRAPIALRPLA